MISILYCTVNEIIDAFLELGRLYISESYTMKLIQNHVIFILLLCSFIFIKKYRKKVDTDAVVSYQKEKFIYIIVLIMAAAVYMDVSLMRYVIRYVQNDKFMVFYHVITAVSLLSIVVMLFLVKHIIYANQITSKLLKNEKQLNEMQEIYYKTLLQREENTKKIIHDMKAHMICLESLIYNEENDAVKEYVENLNTELKVVTGKCYYSGNDMVDILLNYYFSQVGENVSISVLGHWDNQMNISRNGICTICSNLLKNAVEEVNRCNDVGYIVVKLVKGKQYSQIEVRNSISEKYKKASKWNSQEEKNHGYGLKNVQELVKKNHGSMDIEENGLEYKITISI